MATRAISDPQLASTLSHERDHWKGRFFAMASPCEVLLNEVAHRDAAELVEIAAAEAARIERKFSRYRADSVVQLINTARGQRVEVDEETAKLLDYAAECYAISDGLFDVTSGVLRRVWKFDGSDRLPPSAAVEALLPLIGWDKVTWDRPWITLPAGMEIDFGGIGKEYAVDTTATLLRSRTAAGFVVNYGGDLYVSGPRRSGKDWVIGVDDPLATGEHSVGSLTIARGGIATSGDARRFLLKDGVRYSHILNPKTGWPVTAAPHSVTVIADTCIEAGILATLAMLQGPDAETFLTEQEVKFWANR
ncbi:MAG TPA: FAD:protein FMN transferase [bacterium]